MWTTQSKYTDPSETTHRLACTMVLDIMIQMVDLLM